MQRIALVAVAAAAVAAAAAAAVIPRTAPAVQVKDWPAGVVTRCVANGTFALTFDDGPWVYSQALLDILAAEGVSASFFVNGQNWGSIWDFGDELRNAHAAGHVLGSHTWDHADLVAVYQESGAAGVADEMNQLADALEDLVGVRPAFMRPPYGSIDDAVLGVLTGLGYTAVVNWNVDSNDWQHPDDPDADLAEYKAAMGGIAPATASWISLQHDVYNGTVELFVPMAIQYVRSAGYQLVNMSACLGLPPYQPARL